MWHEADLMRNVKYIVEHICNDYCDKMIKTTEDSPYHRESSVYTHTMWTVEETIKIAIELGLNDYDTAVAVLVATFHDFGKPDMEETLYSDNIGWYRRYKGHEKHSARIFVDVVNERWSELVQTRLFVEVAASDCKLMEDLSYNIPLMIQHHVPYTMNDKSLRNLLTSLENKGNMESPKDVFMAACLGDATGRKVDDRAGKLEGAVKWIPRWDAVEQMSENQDFDNFDLDSPRCFVLIGPSGAGKNTWIENMNIPEAIVFSLDDCRVNFYCQEVGCTDTEQNSEEIYKEAFNYCNEHSQEFNKYVDKEWSEALNSGEDIIVNNTNCSKKSRKRWIATARQKGYLVEGVVFNSASLNELKRRQHERNDKFVPDDAVEKQFYSLTLPILDDEFDLVSVD